MSRHYSIADYDKHLCLKPNFAMWFIQFYLLMPYVVLILSIVNRRDRTELLYMMYPDRIMMSLSAMAGIPALFVIYAWVKRKPDAGIFVKSVWHRGREILMFSSLLNIGAAFIPYLLDSANRISIIILGHIIVAVLIILILYTSPYIRDCFNDFPVEVESEGE